MLFPRCGGTPVRHKSRRAGAPARYRALRTGCASDRPGSERFLPYTVTAALRPRDVPLHVTPPAVRVCSVLLLLPRVQGQPRAVRSVSSGSAPRLPVGLPHYRQPPPLAGECAAFRGTRAVPSRHPRPVRPQLGLACTARHRAAQSSRGGGHARTHGLTPHAGTTLFDVYPNLTHPLGCRHTR